MVDLNIKLPESFLQEEERDGYLVSAKMKELWAVQLDLLCELDRVCKKYGLKYILDFGTLLGAIRHKGYIPWDDDLDVSMLREDYDKLMEVGPKEFKHPYFLQNQITDKYYADCVTKLRRSDTLFINQYHKGVTNRYNQGIFIDIFVFDNVNEVEENALKAISKNSRNAYFRMMVLAYPPMKNDGIKFPFKMIRLLLYKLRYGSGKKEYQRLEQRAKECPRTGIVCSVMYVNPHCRPLDVYDEIIEVPFEQFMMPVPARNNEVLRLLYGDDYMTPHNIPSGHRRYLFDVNHSYDELKSDVLNILEE